jgi:hypothetical protein
MLFHKPRVITRGYSKFGTSGAFECIRTQQADELRYKRLFLKSSFLCGVRFLHDVGYVRLPAGEDRRGFERIGNGFEAAN